VSSREARLSLAASEHGLGPTGIRSHGLALLQAQSALQFRQQFGLQGKGGLGPFPFGAGAVQLGQAQDFVLGQGLGSRKVGLGQGEGGLGVTDPGLALGQLFGAGAVFGFELYGLSPLELSLVPVDGGFQFFGLDPGQEVTRLHTLALVGRLADAANIGDNGSSAVDPSYVITPAQGIRNRFSQTAVTVVNGPPLSTADRPVIPAA